MTNSIRIALVGQGAIGAHVANAVKDCPEIEVAAIICRPGSLERARQFAGGGIPAITHIAQIDPKPDLLVDCAGHAGLAEHGPVALAAGIEVVTISTGALSDGQLAEQLEEAAKAGKTRVKLLAGAIGGTDVLSAAITGQMTDVTYVGRKPPAGWRGSPAEALCDLEKLTAPFTHFSGTARDAAQKYPKNANVAATIALAGVGLDNTHVELIADPNAAGNTHEVTASGAFGELHLRIVGNALASNPRSSALAAMSIVAELQKRTKAIVI